MDLFNKEQKVTLFFQKEENMVEMICSILDVKDDRLDLNLPQYFMRYIEFLQVGKKLTAKAFTKLGTIDFNTIVISSPLEETFTIELDYNSIKLTPGKEIPQINAIESLEVKRDGIFSLMKTFAISTEYIKFYSDIKFNIEEEIKCSLILPKDYGIIDFIAKISEIDAIYSNEYTAIYVTMTEANRQTLLYYMYMYSKDTD